MSTIGIFVSISGFVAFTHYKMKRKRQSNHKKYDDGGVGGDTTIGIGGKGQLSSSKTVLPF